MIKSLLVGLLIVIFVILVKNLPSNIFQEKITKSLGEQLSSQYRIIKNGPFEIHSFEVAPLVGKTEIFTQQSIEPILSLDNFYFNSMFIDLDTQTSKEIFEIQLNAGGKLINSLLYQNQEGKLIRIPVITRSGSKSWDTWSSGGTEFIDTDKDGIKEMLVYHRHYPPEAKRTVEVYKFDSKIFQKDHEYEEITQEIYY